MKKVLILVFGLFCYSTILQAQSPVMKFINGEKKNFKTQNLPKAQGVALAVDYPKEWKLENPSQPDVVQKFIGVYDKITATFQIQITQIKQADDITALKEAMKSNQFDKMQPYISLINPDKSIEFSQGMSYKIKEQDGFWLKGTQKQADGNVVFYKTYLWAHNDFLICIPFSTSGEGKELATKNFSKYESLFKLILESVFVGN